MPISYDVPSQAGRRLVVTGSNTGIGKEVARRLALAGAQVVMAVRSVEKGEAARADILREAPAADVNAIHAGILPGRAPRSWVDSARSVVRAWDS